MPMGIIFWVLMLVWLVFGILAFGGWGTGPYGHVVLGGGTLLQFILFLLLGWKVYGPPVQ